MEVAPRIFLLKHGAFLWPLTLNMDTKVCEVNDADKLLNGTTQKPIQTSEVR